MTDEGRNEPGDSGEARQKWTDEVQEALDRTGDAVRTAWEATRESRMSALESAKQAVKELGDVLEKGVGVAKERWASGDATAEKPPTAPGEPAGSSPTAPPQEPPDVIPPT